MKSIFIKIFIALSAFLIGVFAFCYWSNSLQSEIRVEIATSSELKQLPIQVSACQLDDYPESFDGELVNLEATAYVIYDGTIILAPKDCYFQTGNMVFSRLELNFYTGSHDNLKNMLEGKNRNSKEDFKEIDVKVIGVARITYNATGYKMYSIYPSDITLTSTLRKFKPRGAA